MRELVEYFESHGMNYYFITMGRHPCYFDQAKHEHYAKKADVLVDGLPFLPNSRHVHILYEEMMIRPEFVTQRIIDKIPELEYLDFGINGMEKPQKTPEEIRKKAAAKAAKAKFRSKHPKEKKAKRKSAAKIKIPIDHQLKLHMNSKNAVAEQLEGRLLTEHEPTQDSATRPASRALNGQRDESIIGFASLETCKFYRRVPCYNPEVARALGFPVDPEWPQEAPWLD